VTPDVSIIVPTFNRAPILRGCLMALTAQDVPREAMEVVVVDDGSTDDTGATVAAVTSETDRPILYQRQTNQGANAARNRALGIATGRLLLFINDDTIATQGMVAAHLRMHDAHPHTGEAALGALHIAPDLAPSIFNELHHDHALDAVPAGTDLGWRAFFTFNLSVKAALLREGGMFNETLRWHEDIELGRRLEPRGLHVRYTPDAVGHHYHPMTETGWLGIADREGQSLADWLRAAPQMKDELVALGLHAKALGTRDARHVVADMLMMPPVLPVWMSVARWLSARSPTLAMAIYRKLFQHRKRRAIDRALAVSGAPRPSPLVEGETA
jgi:GT2 family glycosyltransferase